MKPILAVLIALLLIAALLASLPVSHALSVQGQVSLSGRLNILWGDGPAGSGLEQVLYYLTDETGQRTQLRFEDPLPVPIDQLLGWRGKAIIVNGDWASAPSAPSGENPFLNGILQARSITADPRTEGDSLPLAPQVLGPQPWVTILCKFNGNNAEPKPASYFQNMYGSVKPGLDHYWREQSFDQINVVGSASVDHWYTLPHPRSYYLDAQGSFNKNQAAADCTMVADAVVHYPTYVGINLMFNDILDGYAWGGGHFMFLDGVTRLWYMTWEPPWGYSDITVIAHEMGHGFGMPHSSGMYGQTYDNEWDVMSDTWSNCGSSTDPTYGCLGQHTISYHKDISQWIAPQRKYTVNPANLATITLERLALPTTGDYLMVKIPIAGSSTLFYTVEARRKVGYDGKLPGEAVIIHEVNTTRQRPANVVDIDGNGDTGDDGARWVVGETFTDSANHIWVRVDSSTSSGFVVTVSNNFSGSTNSPTVTHTATPTRTVTPTSTASASPTVTRTATASPTFASQVEVIVAWTADGASQSRSIFYPGDTIRYLAQIENFTGSPQTTLLTWQASGPCGSIASLSGNHVFEAGSTSLYWQGVIPSNACGGAYTYQLSATFGGTTSTRWTTFDVLWDVLMPLLIRN